MIGAERVLALLDRLDQQEPRLVVGPGLEQRVGQHDDLVQRDVGVGLSSRDPAGSGAAQQREGLVVVAAQVEHVATRDVEADAQILVAADPLDRRVGPRGGGLRRLELVAAAAVGLDQLDPCLRGEAIVTAGLGHPHGALERRHRLARVLGGEATRELGLGDQRAIAGRLDLRQDRLEQRPRRRVLAGRAERARAIDRGAQALDLEGELGGVGRPHAEHQAVDVGARVQGRQRLGGVERGLDGGGVGRGVDLDERG